MSTVIIAIIVFGVVGLAAWYLIDDKVHHKGKTGCAGCSGSCSSCSGGCGECGSGGQKHGRAHKK